MRLNAPGFTMAPVAATLVQIVQLQRDAPAFGSRSTSKRTAPQWQLPRCLVASEITGALVVCAFVVVSMSAPSYGLLGCRCWSRRKSLGVAIDSLMSGIIRPHAKDGAAVRPGRVPALAPHR